MEILCVTVYTNKINDRSKGVKCCMKVACKSPSHEMRQWKHGKNNDARWAKTSGFCLITNFKRFQMFLSSSVCVCVCELCGQISSLSLAFNARVKRRTICLLFVVCVSRNVQPKQFFWHLTHLILFALSVYSQSCLRSRWNF